MKTLSELGSERENVPLVRHLVLVAYKGGQLYIACEHRLYILRLGKHDYGEDGGNSWQAVKGDLKTMAQFLDKQNILHCFAPVVFCRETKDVPPTYGLINPSRVKRIRYGYEGGCEVHFRHNHEPREASVYGLSVNADDYGNCDGEPRITEPDETVAAWLPNLKNDCLIRRSDEENNLPVGDWVKAREQFGFRKNPIDTGKWAAVVNQYPQLRISLPSRESQTVSVPNGSRFAV